MMERVTLTPRLQAIAERIQSEERVADIGTDHGYLPLYLRRNGHTGSLIASDIRTGPLNAAIRHAREAGIDDIDFRLCAGLEGIRETEADTVVIAGMSGDTMAAILSAAGWDWTAKKLLLQPMTGRAVLLQWLYTNGCRVLEETYVPESAHDYWLFTATGGEAPMPGPAFLHAGFTETPYAQRLYRLKREALEGLKRARQPDPERIRETEILLADMESVYGWHSHRTPGSGPTE